MLRFIKNLYNPEIIMADERDDVSNLRTKVIEYKSSIAALQAEVRRKQEKFVKIDKDMAKLGNEIQAKDKLIRDLHTRINQMQDSMEEMAAEVSESKNLVNNLKAELEVREGEVSILRKENFKLSNKLKRSDSQTKATTIPHYSPDEPPAKLIKNESDAMLSQHRELSQMNQNLARELDSLNKQVQLLSHKNLELTAEIERRSKTSEQIKMEYDEAMQSRKHLEDELKNLRGKVDALYNGNTTTNVNASESPISLPREPLKPKISTDNKNATQQQVTEKREGISRNVNNPSKYNQQLKPNTTAPGAASRLPVYRHPSKENQVKPTITISQNNETKFFSETTSHTALGEDKDITRENAINSIRDILQKKLVFPTQEKTGEIRINTSKQNLTNDSNGTNNNIA